VLVLAHTHAAVDTLAGRIKAKNQGVDIRTIDGLVCQIASAYHAALGLPPDRVSARRDLYSEITKQARNWLGGKLDPSQRSQIMFMDRDDILNPFIVNHVPLPEEALLMSEDGDDGEIPF